MTVDPATRAGHHRRMGTRLAALAPLLAMTLSLPEVSGGYLLTAKFLRADSEDPKPTISRRYLKIGDESTPYRFSP